MTNQNVLAAGMQVLQQRKEWQDRAYQQMEDYYRMARDQRELAKRYTLEIKEIEADLKLLGYKKATRGNR